ncbi:MAG: putative sugar O-methyltransferase [Verrucomicrobia bacterium]|nr:putative sugar O-methyltransferase [Verrucomicrobiota bacterium]
MGANFMRVTGRVRLRDNRPISDEEFRRAVGICSAIRRLVDSRADYIAEKRLDPEIALPGNNWDPNADQPFQNRYRHIVEGNYDVLNRLRLYAQFSSFDLVTQSIVTRGREVPKIPDDFDERFEHRFPGPDHWIERYRMITRFVPVDIRARFPKVLGEIGWEMEGHPVNHDVYAYQERVNLMYEAGLIDELRRRIRARGVVNILEIGGGYGGLAHALTGLLHGAVNYTICDLPESLLSSAIYLGVTHPKLRHVLYEGNDPSSLATSEQWMGFRYIPNAFFDDFCELDEGVDLAINTLSFPEMAQAQVRYYGDRLKRLIGDGGALFEQNEDGRWMGMLDCKSILAESFPCKRRISPKTIPVVSKGEADVWSNQPLDTILASRTLPFEGLPVRMQLSLWRLSCLMTTPSLGLIWLRQMLQRQLSPGLFAMIKRLWNRLGGRMRA